MTASSLRTLASALDRLVASGSFVHETSEAIIVSELSAKAAREVSQGFAEVAWQDVVFDGASTETGPDDIADDFGPYRITAQKPPRGGDDILLLTASGFRDWLAGPAQAKVVVVVGLDAAIATEGTQFVPVEASNVGVADVVTLRSPRTLVREYGLPKAMQRRSRSGKTANDPAQPFDAVLPTTDSAAALSPRVRDNWAIMCPASASRYSARSGRQAAARSYVEPKAPVLLPFAGAAARRERHRQRNAQAAPSAHLHR